MKPLAQRNTPKLGQRNTKQREAVVNTLKNLNAFASAKTIHETLTESGHTVGLTTVYRTLQALAEIGAVDEITMAGGQTLYRHCLSDEHHHHLVCTRCGRTEEIDGGPVETWARTVAKEHGYTVHSHDAEVYGYCPSCQEALNQ